MTKLFLAFLGHAGVQVVTVIEIYLTIIFNAEDFS